MDELQIEIGLLSDLRARMHADLFTGASAVDTVVEIRRGVTAMIQESRTSDQDFQEARESLGRFMDGLVAARDSRGLSEFHEETVSFAMGGLCPPPCWPFCK
jgi:hypothetical protein